jgi:hypothetical protein
MRVALRLTLANHDLSVTSASAGAQAAIPGPISLAHRSAPTALVNEGQRTPLPEAGSAVDRHRWSFCRGADCGLPALRDNWQ